MKPNENGYWDRFWEFENLHKDFDSRIANSLDSEEIEAVVFLFSSDVFSEEQVRASLESYIRHNPTLLMKHFFDTFQYWLSTSFAKRVLKEGI